MAHPLRRLRWLVGLGLLAGTAYVTWLLTQADIQPSAPIVEREAPPEPSRIGSVGTEAGDGGAPEAAVEPTSTCVESFRGERFESVRGLTAGLACLQTDESWLMEQGVRIRLEGQGSAPPIVVSSRRGVLPSDRDGAGPLLLSGEVLVEGEGGFQLETEELELYRMRQLVISPTPARFRRGEASGTAGRLEHDWGQEETRLSEGATVVLLGDEVGDQPITVRGERIRFMDSQGRVEVRGRGSIDLEGGQVSGESLDVDLSEDRAEVRRVEATGGAETRSFGGGGALLEGGLATRHLTAGRIVHVFGKGNELESIEATRSVVLSGSSIGAGGRAGGEQVLGDRAVLRFAGGKVARLESIVADGAPARLSSERGAERVDAVGERVELELDAGGELRSLVALRQARIELNGTDGGRRIEAEEVEIEMSGEEIERLRFRGSPGLIEELPQDGVAARRLRAASGDLRFGPGGRPLSGDLEGAVRIEAPPYEASGREVRVEGEGTRVVIEGQASIEGPGRSSHGERAVYDSVAETLAVIGEQHTIVTDTSGSSGLGDFVSGREPVLISAERMDVDLRTRRVVYAAPGGGTRPDLRQGDISLRGDVLTLEEDSGDLQAEGSVESVLRLSQPDGRVEPAKPGLFDPTGLITGTCERFRYERATSVVRYDGDVNLSQGEMILSAEEVEVGLAQEGSSVEYLKARRRAYYEGPDFQAEGELIDYDLALDLVRVEGGRRPARAVRVGGDLATGAVLELGLSEEGIRITAPYGGRTRGRSGPAAGEQGQ